MKIQFWNPFSDKFLQPEPEHQMVRSAEAALNSYGRSEDAVDWKRLTHGYLNGYVEGSDVYDASGIMFEQVFSNKRQRISTYRNLALYPFVRKCLTMMADEAVCENALGEVAIFDIDRAFKSKFTETELMTLRDEFNYIINEEIGRAHV